MGKGGMDVLVPQRMMIIKPPNSIISPLLFITILGLKKKKKDLKYGQRGVVPYGSTNKITQTLQKQAGYISPSVQ